MKASIRSPQDYQGLQAEETGDGENPAAPLSPFSPGKESVIYYRPDGDKSGHGHKVINSLPYTVVSIAALVIALFTAPFFVVFNVPDYPAVPLQDALMMAVMVFFTIDLALSWTSRKGYACSLFFWMDLFGTASIVFEVSFLLGQDGSPVSSGNGVQNFSPVVLRTARAARFPARLARLPRLLKLQNWLGRHLPRHMRTGDEGFSDDEHSDDEQHHGDETPSVDARVLKARLANSLSSKAALLTMTLMMGLPLFTLWHDVEDNLALSAWGRALELGYREAYRSLASEESSADSSKIFSRSVSSMVTFFEDLPFQPFRLEGFDPTPEIGGRQVSIPGQDMVSGEEPQRQQNIVVQHIDVCAESSPHPEVEPWCRDVPRPKLLVDFTESRQLDAVLDIVMICFFMCVMLITSFGLTRTVDIMIVIPVERMLGTVQMMAKILHTVAHMTGSPVHHRDTQAHDPSSLETLKGVELVEGVFRSVLALTEKILKSGFMEAHEVQALDREGQGVLLDVLMLSNENKAGLEQGMKGRESLVLDSEAPCVPDLSICQEDVLDWGLNLLTFQEQDLSKLVLWVFFDSSIGRSVCRPYLDIPSFHHFSDAVRKRYLPNPYHNYIHGCDVLASTFRTLYTLRCWDWLSEMDSLALLVSALCHDVGHPGRTTPFLVETGDELAMRYNDASPLENMHCATLFEICQSEDSKIFKKLERDDFKQVRKVCISAILNTDNAKHFDMVKALKAAYELTSDICDAQSRDPDNLHDSYKEEVLLKSTPLWHHLILHMCDVATPLKPWDTSRAWVELLHNEFFEQGDEEKRLGIPVGMLNDREKVLRSGIEHGFINFLVAPMMLNTVSIFPVLHERLDVMFTNATNWRQYWVQDAQPSAQDIAKRDEDLDRIEDQIEKMRFRRPMRTLRTAVMSSPAAAAEE